MKFCSTTVSLPEDPLERGKYLGLLIDVDPVMTAKILTPTGKIVHCSTYRPLTPEKLADFNIHDIMKAFLQWGTCLTKEQLEEVGLVNTLDPQQYQDDEQTRKTFPVLKEEFTLEAGDK